jgi:ABC-type branched-chain amino acid transport systems, ATPase component
MLKIEDLHVFYGGIHALKGLSLEVSDGQIVTLIGANGAGKSSTLRSISGLVKNKKGKILFEGQNILGKTPESLVGMGIAMCPEGRRILPHLTVMENLMLGAYIRNDREGIAKDLDWVFELFPRLKERTWQKGGTLSGGEQQMLALGRALMSRPKLLMLDEPSLGTRSASCQGGFRDHPRHQRRGQNRSFGGAECVRRAESGKLCLRAGGR